MNLRFVGVCLGIVVAGLAWAARAAAVPVTVECSSLIDIQSYNVGEDASDQAYLLVTGIAAGMPVNERFPKEKTWTLAPKKQPIEANSPVELWKGELDDGQFTLLTVTLMQGTGQNAELNKSYLDQVNAAEAKVPEFNKKSLTADDFKKLAEGTLKANQSVVTKIKDLYSREKKTDHYGGQFTLIVWNNGGKLQKRIDPVGLTFGEHNGNDIKIYSKLKNTRNNVLMKNDKGEWEEQQLEPLSDDSSAVRVKELETEYIKQAGANPLRHVTDYLVEIKVLGGDGKPLTWTTEAEVTGIDNIHTYWPYAD